MVSKKQECARLFLFRTCHLITILPICCIRDVIPSKGCSFLKTIGPAVENI